MGGLTSGITVSSVVFSVLVIFCMFLRVVARRSIKTLGWDDSLMVLAGVFFCIDNILAIVATLYGIGVKGFEVDFTKPLLGAKWIIIWGILYTISTVPVKISLCLSVFRVKKTSMVKSMALVLSALTIIAAITQNCWLLFACSPLSYLWDKDAKSGTCSSPKAILISIYMFTAICTAVDWIVATMVFGIIRNIEMSMASKLSTWAVFGIGLLASIATAVRIWFIRAFVSTGYQSPDFYYYLGGIILTSQFEIVLLILGSCVPLVLQGARLVNWHFWKKIDGKWYFLKPTEAVAIDDEEAGRLLGNSVTITAGLTEQEKKSRKRKSKKRSKKICTECGKRNCKDHIDDITPLNVPEGCILVTETVEVTYESADRYNVPDSAITPFDDRPSSNRNSVISTGSGIVSRTPSGRSARYRQLDIPSENVYAMDQLDDGGRRLSVADTGIPSNDTTRVNSISSEAGPSSSSKAGRRVKFVDV